MVADRLVGSDEQLVSDLRARPALVHEALAAIAATFAGFARACLAAGASGIFFATTWATRGKLTPAEYDEFGRRYDLQVLDAVRAAPFNVLHVCRSENRLLDLADYPVAAFSWAATDPTNPSLAEAAKKLPGAVIGGLSNEALVAATPELARAEARAALERPALLPGWPLLRADDDPAGERARRLGGAGRLARVLTRSGRRAAGHPSCGASGATCPRPAGRRVARPQRGGGTSREAEARLYEDEALKAGRTVVMVRADGRAAEAASILRAYGAYNLREEPATG